MSVEERRPELTHPDFLRDQPAALQEVARAAAPFAETYLLRPFDYRLTSPCLRTSSRVALLQKPGISA